MSKCSELPDLLEKSTSAIGAMIGLGKKFVESGIREMDSSVLPELCTLVGKQAIPRVLPSYAILIWFTMEVHFQASLEIIMHMHEVVPKWTSSGFDVLHNSINP